MLPSPTNAIDFMQSASLRSQFTTGVAAGQRTLAPSGRTLAACYNPAASMLRHDWVLLVTGTLLGMVSLTADLVGIGAFPGFGWKQIVGTLAALMIVAPAAWRIYRGTRQDDP
jgi:hypothetical protein